MAQAVALPGQEVIGVIPPGELTPLGIVTAVPIVQVNWFDERQTCKVAHDYLEGKIEGQPDDYQRCTGYAAGVCRSTRAQLAAHHARRWRPGAAKAHVAEKSAPKRNSGAKNQGSPHRWDTYTGQGRDRRSSRQA